jgi:hypothetical protein
VEYAGTWGEETHPDSSVAGDCSHESIVISLALDRGHDEYFDEEKCPDGGKEGQSYSTPARRAVCHLGLGHAVVFGGFKAIPVGWCFSIDWESFVFVSGGSFRVWNGIWLGEWEHGWSLCDD